jgi:glucosamine--fructose-6-phosphate aminotransferase (isomerizing)
VATEKTVTITSGRHDNRTIVLIPEVKDGQTVGITLLHARLHERLPEAAARGVLQGYRNRYSALRDFVTETEPTFRDDLLATVDIADLLIRPVAELAELWRTP